MYFNTKSYQEPQILPRNPQNILNRFPIKWRKPHQHNIRKEIWHIAFVYLILAHQENCFFPSHN